MAEFFVRPERVRVACVVVAILCGVSVRAQQTEAGPTGSVVGSVEFDETRLPARFAQIRLVPKPGDADLVHVEGQTQASEKRGPHLSVVTGISEMDGRFRIDGVPDGDYFAGAFLSGYVTPGTSAAVDVATDEQLKQLIASMPVVHIKAGQVASVNVTLHRGAVIAGRVQFADGSPAIGAQVGWELAERDIGIQSVRLARPSPLQEIVRLFEYDTQHNHGGMIDDEGHYRIFGLPPGKYIVSTVIVSQLGSGRVIMSDGSDAHASDRNQMIPNITTVYGPGVFRRGEAKVFEIRGDEQVTDADVKIDMSGLHTIRGKVLAGEDRQVPSQVMVRLKEGGRDLPQLATTEEDGSFQIYVPSGSYTLLVTGWANLTVPANTADIGQPSRNYQQAKVAVVVGAGDVALGEVVLTALKPGEKMEY
ncbi:MAG: carboxypeptidase-like regulatory domain-containing protein [Edaphobacter sp.]